MAFDLFISYARKDDSSGRISQLVNYIAHDFESFSGRSLKVFFDRNDIRGMDDWRHQILKGLRESRVLLACLSPAYLKSSYCEWEFNEFIKNEIHQSWFGEGVAPAYFVEVPGWQEKGFENKCAEWVTELRRRHHFDLRPWFTEGEESIRNSAVKEHMSRLNQRLNDQILRHELDERAPGNMDSHNFHFIGRTSELRRIREHFVSPGTIGLPVIIHGMGGVGKTALATEYAHAFLSEYGGGRWQVRCEGKRDLTLAIAGLASPLHLSLNEEEKKDTLLQFQKVIATLKNLTLDSRKPHCLLMLDNADTPELLQTDQLCRLPVGDWLHLIVTTRMGEAQLPDISDKNCFVSVDELPEPDAVAMIESYQREGKFPDEEEYLAAREIVQILGCFTLAVESAAVYLQRNSGHITCKQLLARIRKEGVHWDSVEYQTKKLSTRHGSHSLAMIMEPAFEMIPETEKLILKYAACLPPEHIPLAWLKALASQSVPELGKEPEPGYPDAWHQSLRALIGFRYVSPTGQKNSDGEIVTLKMHRLVRSLIQDTLITELLSSVEVANRLDLFLLQKSKEINPHAIQPKNYREIECLFEALLIQLKEKKQHAKSSAVFGCNLLLQAGFYPKTIELASAALLAPDPGIREVEHKDLWFNNIAGSACMYLADYSKAEEYLNKARELSRSPGVNMADKLDSIINLGCLYRETYRPSEALNPSMEALQLCRLMYGNNSPRYASQMVNTSLVYQDLGRLNNAIPLYREAVFIYDRHDELAVDRCNSYSTLTEALRNNSQVQEAYLTAETALTIVKENKLEDHPAMINLLTNYAALLEDNLNPDEARPHYEKALALTIRCFGESSGHLAIRYNNLGVNSILTDHFKQAVDELTLALEVERNKAKPDYHSLAHRYLNLAAGYLFLGETEKANDHLRAGWKCKLQSPSPDIVSLRLLFLRIAVALIKHDRFELEMGQLLTLSGFENIPAAGNNLKWTLESKLLALVSNCDDDRRPVFPLLIERFKKRQLTESPGSLAPFEGVMRKPLIEEW